MQAGNQLALRLLRDIAPGLLFDLLKGRKRFHPLFFDLDDMPAELALDRVGDLPRLHLERRLGEFRHHLVAREPAEISAFAARIFGQLSRHLGEILAALDPRQRLLGVFLGRQQNMAGVNFRLRRLLLGGFVIGLMFGLIGRRFRASVAQHRFHAQLIVIIGHAAGEIGARIKLVGGGLLGHEPHVDQIIDHIFLPRRPLQLGRQAGTYILKRVFDVLFGDGDAIDLGQNLGLAIGKAGRAQQRNKAQCDQTGWSGVR